MNNKQFKLAARPQGLPKSTDWLFETSPVPELKDNEVLMKVHYLSLDPAMRGWMNDGKSYIRPVQLGEVMRAGGVGEVLDSKSPKFQKGDFVVGNPGIQEYACVAAEHLNKIDVNLAPIEKYLSVLGMTGLTAYFALLDVGQPKSGETVVMSAAAGAVGSIAGQIAKIKGCRVVGLAGGAEKCKMVIDEFGFDDCIDYKAETDIRSALKRTCPNGIDVYFDNVGGDILDAALTQINMKARIVICGAISQYNNTTPVKGPANYMSLLVNRARMEGMVVFDYANRYQEAIVEMFGWTKTGKLNSKEHIVEGIENFPDTLLKLFKGENNGKLMLKVV